MSLMCFQRGRSWKRGIVKPQDLTLLGPLLGPANRDPGTLRGLNAAVVRRVVP